MAAVVLPTPAGPKNRAFSRLSTALGLRPRNAMRAPPVSCRRLYFAGRRQARCTVSPERARLRVAQMWKWCGGVGTLKRGPEKPPPQGLVKGRSLPRTVANSRRVWGGCQLTERQAATSGLRCLLQSSRPALLWIGLPAVACLHTWGTGRLRAPRHTIHTLRTQFSGSCWSFGCGQNAALANSCCHRRLELALVSTPRKHFSHW